MIGIATLLYAVPLLLALAHQAMAILLLTLAVLQTARLTAQPAGVSALSRA